MSVQRGRHPEPSNPWKSGSFYLVAFVVVAIVLAAVGANGSPWVPVLVLIGGVVGIGAIGALQLRQDDRLSEKNFLELMGMTYRKLPVVRKLTESKEAERRPEPD